MTTINVNQSILDHAIEGIESLKGTEPEASELHHKLFNEDYFIIGTHRAKQFCNEYKDGAFDAIGKVQEYEDDKFGEVSTDLSDPEKVANMLAYILGEELLGNSKTFLEKYDETLTDADLDTIANELKSANN